MTTAELCAVIRGDDIYDEATLVAALREMTRQRLQCLHLPACPHNHDVQGPDCDGTVPCSCGFTDIYRAADDKGWIPDAHAPAQRTETKREDE